MARFSVLLALCAAATAASTTPFVVRDTPVTLPLARRFNFTGSSKIVELDRARAQVLKAVGHANANAKRAVPSVMAVNEQTHYTVLVGVGASTPQTMYNMLLDTGSANMVIGGGKAYDKTSTSKDTGNTVAVTYGSGSFTGEQYTDTVTLGPLTVQNQGVAIANQTTGFPGGVDGILGIGPAGLSRGTVSDFQLVPTVFDNAFEQDQMTAEVVGFAFAPASQVSTPNGLLTFGGTDSSQFTGNVQFASITGTSPASNYLGFDASVTYGSDTPILKQTSGIVDTGTTLVLLATDAFEAYKNATGAVLDDATGLLKITNDQYANLQSLFFTRSSTTYEFVPNAQIWPRSLNTAIGGDADSIYLVVADLGSPSGSGLDFINGYAWLERFYTAYNGMSSQLGIATTKYTNSTDN
ncbi:acid protease [Ganoderma leucocontextum]|nr:acid protease [Ganoderma leucocontextum]